jgi:hypothetical protein
VQGLGSLNSNHSVGIVERGADSAPRVTACITPAIAATQWGLTGALATVLALAVWVAAPGGSDGAAVAPPAPSHHALGYLHWHSPRTPATQSHCCPRWICRTVSTPLSASAPLEPARSPRCHHRILASASSMTQRSWLWDPWRTESGALLETTTSWMCSLLIG